MAIHVLRSRVLAAGFVSVLICLSVVLAGCTFLPGRSSSTTTTAAAVTPTVETDKALHQFSVVRGTDYLRAPIGRVEARSGDYFSSSSGYSSVANHNFVFVNLRDETIHKLLPTNDAVIVLDVGLPHNILASTEPDAQAADKEILPVAWFLYSVVKADTSGDGSLSVDDLKTLAVSDMGGRGYTEVITNVERLYHYTLHDNETLLVIYRQAGQPFLARIDLPARAVTSRTKFPALGPDVK